MSSANIARHGPIPEGRIFSATGPASVQTINGGTPTALNLGSLVEDTGFSWSDANDEVTCTFTGRALFSYSVNAEIGTTGTRDSFIAYFEEDTGSGYAVMAGTARRDYFRASTKAGTAALHPTPFDVVTGSKYRLIVDVDTTPQPTRIFGNKAGFTIQRIQAAS